jgi:hypothetical protein
MVDTRASRCSWAQLASSSLVSFCQSSRQISHRDWSFQARSFLPQISPLTRRRVAMACRCGLWPWSPWKATSTTMPSATRWERNRRPREICRAWGSSRGSAIWNSRASWASFRDSANSTEFQRAARFLIHSGAPSGSKISVWTTPVLRVKFLVSPVRSSWIRAAAR